MNGLVILVGIIFLLGLALLYLYNSMVAAKFRVKESFSGIDVQLKRRADLIPNLVETVKGYVKHEREVLENVTKARTALVSARDPKSQAQANDMLSGALKSLFAVAEDYPDLKASVNFKELQDELSDTETKIASARQFYNNNVLDYNTRMHTFPGMLIASLFNFRPEEFFEADESERKEVEVKFA